MTTMSRPGSNDRSSAITRGTVCSSLSAGTIATRRSSESATGGRDTASRSAVLDTAHHGHTKAEEVQELAGAMHVRVLVEHALACTAAEFLRLSGIRE